MGEKDWNRKLWIDERVLTDEHGNYQEVNAVVGYWNEFGLNHVLEVSRSAKQGRALKRVNAVQAMLTKPEIDELLHDPSIKYVELNYEARLLGEAESYGLLAIGGGKNNRPFPDSTDSGACNDDSVLKVAIVDSGVNIQHPDLGMVANSNAVGQSFIASGNYNRPVDSHGKLFATGCKRRHLERKDVRFSIILLTMHVLFVRRFPLFRQVRASRG